tara:strand:- start:31547 stop:32644 length:1098 start_codon:yes stop_codon:yes gene_type:complete
MAVPRRARRVSCAPLVLVLLLATTRAGWSEESTGGQIENDASASNLDGFKIVGYLPEYRFDGVDWNGTCAGVTHLLLFSLEPTVDGALGALDRFPDTDTMRVAKSSCGQYGTKLMVSVGGAGRSRFFPTVTQNKQTRRKFASNLVAFCAKHGLQGVDVNWEYPQDEAEWVSLAKLLRATRIALSKSPIANPELFMAYHPESEGVMKKTGIPEHVILMHAMAYDNVRDTGGHSTLKYAKQVLTNAKAHFGELRKISLGVPFYGRGDGVLKPVGDAKTYAEINQESPIAHEDLDHHAGYLFNGVKTMRSKTAAAIEAGAGGVTVWEVGQDVNFRKKTSLLRAVATATWPEGRPKGGHMVEQDLRSEL